MLGFMKQAIAEKKRFDGLNKNIRALDSFAEAVLTMRMNENNHEIRDKLEQAASALTEAEILYKQFLEKVVEANGE